MYAVMRMLGVNIHPATHQTDDGKKMWDKWRKNGDAKHIKSMNAKMTGVAESNVFTDARMNAIKAGKDTFVVHGKTYQVTGDTTDEREAGVAEAYGPYSKLSAADLERIKKYKEREAKRTVPGQLRKPGTANKSKYDNDSALSYFANINQGVAEARMSAAQRLWNAEQKQRAKSDASLARTPSSIPKPEPKKDEKIAEKIKGTDGKACWKGKRYAGTKNGKDVCIPVSEDVENIMSALINKIIVNEATNK
jgi:hypothetical protein